MGWGNGSCPNGPGHLTKMAAMPIDGKNLKKSSSLEPKIQMILKLSMQHWVFEYYQVCSNDDPELTLTYLTARSNLVLMISYGKKVKQWIFQKLF